MTWANPLYTAAYDFPRRAPEKRVMIAAIGRCGSTYLCAALWRTGGMGAPMEYLQLLNRKKDMIPRLSNGSVRDYWKELQQVRTSPNGVFAYKAFVDQFRWAEEADPALLGDLEYDAALYITRKDKLAQAVSLSRALQAEAWFADAPEKRKPVYSQAAIWQALGLIWAIEQSWERYFETRGLTPFRIVYEDLVEQTDQTVKAIADYLKIDLTGVPPVEIPALKKQRDATSEEWIAAYNAERNNWR